MERHRGTGYHHPVTIKFGVRPYGANTTMDNISTVPPYNQISPIHEESDK